MKTLKATTIALSLLVTSMTAPTVWAYNIVSDSDMALFMNATDNDKDVDKAIAVWKQYKADNPENPAVATYYGNLLASRASHASFPFTKIKYANEGLDVIDKMLETTIENTTDMGIAENTPAYLEAKILSATLFMRVPNLIFQRRAQGMELAQEILADPKFPTVAKSLQARILTSYANELASDNKLDKAKQLAQQALNIDPNGEYTESAQKTLNAKPVGE